MLQFVVVLAEQENVDLGTMTSSKVVGTHLLHTLVFWVRIYHGHDNSEEFIFAISCLKPV